MHPYFVHIPDEPILFAVVAVGAREVTWEFYLQQNGGIDDDQFESIKNLFDLLELAETIFSSFGWSHYGSNRGTWMIYTNPGVRMRVEDSYRKWVIVLGRREEKTIGRPLYFGHLRTVMISVTGGHRLLG